ILHISELLQEAASQLESVACPGALAAQHIAEPDLLATRGGERRLTDILHISELLQEAASQLESVACPGALAAQHIAEPD
ncbi:hypothetical protein CJ430_30965, partial [Klebsiella pneumoniae]